MLKNIHHFCQGYSHLESDKPCQDYAYSESWNDCAMAIVSDGHGGDRYFRSDRGSKFLVEVTANALKEFASVMLEGDDLLKTLRPAFYVFPKNPTREDKNLHQKMQWLFSSIITNWNKPIEEDAKNRELTDWELKHVEEQYKDMFFRGERLEKIYGATLIAYLQTPKFWMAFQIGDGKLVTLKITDSNVKFSQPVPWDDNCFLNKTTSICDADAITEFRYCFCCNGKFPDAVFLGSDGIDDTWGDGDRLNNFYQNIYNELTTEGAEATKKDLEQTLPVLSQRGSKDDMSVACVYDDTRMNENRSALLGYKVGKCSDEMAEVKDKIVKAKEKIKELESIEEPTEAQRIELQYAKNDLSKLEKRWKELIKLKGNVEQQRRDSLDTKRKNKSKSRRIKSKGKSTKKK